MNEIMKTTDNKFEVMIMKKNRQWILCVCIVIFVIAAFMLLQGKKERKLEDGTLVLERIWLDDSLYQSRGQCMS